MPNRYKKMSQYKLFQPLLLLVVMLGAPAAYAGAPEAGDVFLAGSKVEYPDKGVSYILPKSTIGYASADHADYEVLAGILGNSNSSIYIRVGKADFRTIAAQMKGNVMFDGLELLPAGKATVRKGGVTYNDFRINFDEGMRAFVLAVIAKNKTGLMMTAIAPADEIASCKKAMFDIAKTVRIAGVSTHAGRATASGSAHSGKQAKAKRRVSGNHAHEVVGVWMRRSNRRSSGIYIENSSKWAFSADGRVAWGSGAIVAGGTDSVSIRGGGDNPPDYGRWSTKGDELTIHWDDGTTGKWTYTTFEYDGTPYLALTTQGGEVYRYKKID